MQVGGTIMHVVERRHIVNPWQPAAGSHRTAPGSSLSGCQPCQPLLMGTCSHELILRPGALGRLDTLDVLRCGTRLNRPHIASVKLVIDSWQPTADTVQFRLEATLSQHLPQSYFSNGIILIIGPWLPVPPGVCVRFLRLLP